VGFGTARESKPKRFVDIFHYFYNSTLIPLFNCFKVRTANLLKIHQMGLLYNTNLSTSEEGWGVSTHYMFHRNYITNLQSSALRINAY